VIAVGDRVRIERDEVRYPSKGSWPRFRGKTGTVVEVNSAGLGATEYGVALGKTLPASGKAGGNMTAHNLTWFKAHEMRLLRPQRHAKPLSARTPSHPLSREALSHV
jgi:hypothetical protein